MEHPHCNAVFGKCSKSRQKRTQNGGFSGIRGLEVKFLSHNPEKAHPCAKPRLLTILRENRFGGLGCGSFEESGKKEAQ